MDGIKLKRGGREGTFEKVSDRFAVRLRQVRAADEAVPAASMGRPQDVGLLIKWGMSIIY